MEDPAEVSGVNTTLSDLVRLKVDRSRFATLALVRFAAGPTLCSKTASQSIDSTNPLTNPSIPDAASCAATEANGSSGDHAHVNLPRPAH